MGVSSEKDWREVKAGVTRGVPFLWTPPVSEGCGHAEAGAQPAAASKAVMRVALP